MFVIQGEKGRQGLPGPPGEVSLFLSKETTTITGTAKIKARCFLTSLLGAGLIYKQHFQIKNVFFVLDQVIPINIFKKGQQGVPGPVGPPGVPGEQGKIKFCSCFFFFAHFAPTTSKHLFKTVIKNDHMVFLKLSEIIQFLRLHLINLYSLPGSRWPPQKPHKQEVSKFHRY